MSDIEDIGGSLAAGELSFLLPEEESSHESGGDHSIPTLYGDDVGERGLGDGRESGLEDTDMTDDETEDDAFVEETSNTPTPQSNTLNAESNFEEGTNEGTIIGSAVPCLLPWGARKERQHFPASTAIETDLRPGEFVMRTLFADFTLTVDKKINLVLQEPLSRSLSKSLQRGEDSTFDQLISAFGSVAEHCLPSLLRTLFAWYNRQSVSEWGAYDSKYKQDPNKKSSDSWTTAMEKEQIAERRDLAVGFIFCLVLIEVLKQLSVHPGHDDLVKHIEELSFKHFKYREGVQNNPNCGNVNIVADLYAEVVGVLAQSRFQCVRRRFMSDLKELRSKEASSNTTQSITSLLMGMKFFRVKMVPIEEFEASFQFMQECAQYFIEVRDKDVKHALAGLFVEILMTVASTVKTEVNVPCLKNFVEMLYSPTLDMATKNKHKLAIFPLVTCLLCVSQKTFFLANWHYFLAMCLQHLKNRDPKMSRIALEALYRLIWVYMIRIKCESNSATHSRLSSIVNSLFPKGSKAVVPRDTPLYIFVKIIHFIAQERLDFAMKEIIFDLLLVGRPIKMIMSPERMSIGLRAFLVVADGLQQKDGDPPMPKTVGNLPSGNTLRVKKTFLSKMLTEDTARSIGISPYYPLVRKSFNDILKALDSQFGKPLMMTNTQNLNKEPDEMITGERKPKIDLFRACVAAIPRLIPDGMSGQELVDLLSRLTVHMDEELRVLSLQSMQNLVIDFPEWRHEVIYGFVQFLSKEVGDTNHHILDNGLKMLQLLLMAWKNALSSSTSLSTNKRDPGAGELNHLHLNQRGDHSDVLRLTEGYSLVMLCSCRPAPRRMAVAILREAKALSKLLLQENASPQPVIDAMDKMCPTALESVLHLVTPGERAVITSTSNLDLQWLVDRNSTIWTGGFHDDSHVKSASIQHLSGSEDVWPLVLVGFLRKEGVFSKCPLALSHAWQIVYSRINALYYIVDPSLPNENRASLLKSATTFKKTVTERDVHLNLWRNYVVLACCVVPAITKTPIVRCASPDISLGSSPDSVSTEKGSDRLSPVSPQCLYKLLVPLLRCDISDIRDTATLALGKINHLALGDLMEELLPYIRESIDRKQENMRRRKRRDALRVQLVKVFEMCAEKNAFALCESVIDSDTGSLQRRYLEYIEGARAYLEGETDKDNTLLQIKTSFCNFIRKLIESFTLEQRQTLLPRSLRMSLFYLFASWSGPFCTPFTSKNGVSTSQVLSEFEYGALHASTFVLCCGPCFDTQLVSHDGNIYHWLDNLFNSSSEKVLKLAHQTIVLLLEFNHDAGAVLDWVVDQCYVAPPHVADSCFTALATIFSAREYPCDHYTAVMNVTLLNTGCPRANIHETALQLLQVLDKRFFGTVSPIDEPMDNARHECSTLDALLSDTYSRSQLYLSKQLALLHPELTMPMFSEITSRMQSARGNVRQLLFQCLLPWLDNMELVDPSSPQLSGNDAQDYEEAAHDPAIRREGWGSAEATEMVLNNMFYITVKFCDENPKEIEELWAALSSCWPNNLRVIIRYLFIITGMAPQELLPFAKRVTVYVGRAKPHKLVEELMNEIGTVEMLNCVIERTETPPFFRLTSMRKTSSHGEGGGVNNGPNAGDNSTERGGTLHTKRHSGEQEMSKDRYSPQINREQESGPGSLRSVTSKSSAASSVIPGEPHQPSSMTHSQANSTKQSLLTSSMQGSLLLHAPLQDGLPTGPEGICEKLEDNFCALRNQNGFEEGDHSEPHPLPMPEYGGFFAPLTEYLPDSSQPITAFHRCNVAVMLISDVIVAGIDVNSHSVDWSIHISLMLHIITLGLDHSRLLVHQHCKILLVHLLTVVADHHDHLGVAKVFLNNKTTQFGYGLYPSNTFVHNKNFTDEAPIENPTVAPPPTRSEGEDIPHPSAPPAEASNAEDSEEPKEQRQSDTPIIVTSDDNVADDTVSNSSLAGIELMTSDDLQYNIKALVDFIISSKNIPLWNYEDITSKQFSIKSAGQLGNFVRNIVSIFSESLPHAHIEERMAQIALHLALSCSSRHYAGRSLQVFRCLHVSLSSRMLSELLGRLVETVAEQGEDMQGYVTELMLTLEAAVEALHSDFRPIEFVRELFKSTPNLNNQERRCPPNYSLLNHYYSSSYAVAPSHPLSPHGGHFRSTSSTGPYGRVQPQIRGRSSTDADSRMRNPFNSNLSRSRSAQSLKHLADQSSADDKMTVLAQLFWIAVSMLESDYEYEFILAMRLLDKVLSRLSLDRPDCRDKVEKLQQQMNWKDFPGIHALLLKGCTAPNTYEATVSLLSKFTQMTDLQVVDPTQTRAFPINVIALLPYMLLHYEDANDLCIQASENIAQECNEMGKQLENLATVMTLYSRRNFSKESLQWTKCVVKYLHDSYAHLTPTLLAFLVEVLEKGPPSVQNPIINILYCMVHYIDINTAGAQLINGELLGVVAKYIESAHWKEALRILKLAVTRSSSLVVPTASAQTSYWDQHIFTDLEAHFRKELPGRTMEFTYDITQTPIIGRTRAGAAASVASARNIAVANDVFSSKDAGTDHQIHHERESVSPQRSLSLSAADTAQLAGWRRPWLCQVRVRERLVNLLNTCGQRVGLPKSPSVIFSQSSELERQSSMASSTEEVSVAPGGDTPHERNTDDVTSSEKQFAVFKDFDFLDIELESHDEDSIDNFNLWGVRRRSPGQSGGDGDPSSQQEDPPSESTPSQEKKTSKTPVSENEWWEEEGSMSPTDDAITTSLSHTTERSSSLIPPTILSQPTQASTSLPSTPPKLTLDTAIARPPLSPTLSDQSGSSEGDLGDMTPCNASPGIASLLFRPIRQPNELEELWRAHLLSIMGTGAMPLTYPHFTCCLFNIVFTDCIEKFSDLVGESAHYLDHSIPGVTPFLRQMKVISSAALLPYIYIDATLLTITSLVQKFRTTLITLHEHLDTYFDKQKSFFVCLSGIKSTLKLHSLGETLPELSADEQQVDLCRCLYKLQFQLYLLYETFTNFFVMSSVTLDNQQISDHSMELSALRGKLVTASEELDATPPSSPSRVNTTPTLDQRPLPEGEEGESESVGEDSEVASMDGESSHLEVSEGGTQTPTPTSYDSRTSSPQPQPPQPPLTEQQAHHQILQLVADQDWIGAVRYVRRHRSLWPSESFSVAPLDDITIILNIYCSYLSDKKPGMISICGMDVSIDEINKQLTEGNMAALSELRTMELATRHSRDHFDQSLRKTEC